jgi:hypothetical protein
MMRRPSRLLRWTHFLIRCQRAATLVTATTDPAEWRCPTNRANDKHHEPGRLAPSTSLMSRLPG